MIVSIYNCILNAGGQATRRGEWELIRLRSPDSRLSQSEQSHVLQHILPLSDTLFSVDTSILHSRRTAYFRALDNFWSVYRNKSLVGFGGTRGFRMGNVRICYIDNLAVTSLTRRFEKLTLGSVLVHEIISHYASPLENPPVFVFRTQNPSVYRLAHSILPDGIYPGLKEDGRRQRCERALKHVADVTCPDFRFDEQQSVIKQVYGCKIHGRSDLTKTWEATFPGEWNNRLSFDDGDALLIGVCPTSHDLTSTMEKYRCSIAQAILHGPRMRARIPSVVFAPRT